MIPILAKASSVPHKTLGHWKAPSEPHDKTQLSALVTKSKQQAILIATGALSRHGALLAYFAVYVASLSYIIPQCHFDHKHLDKAETKTVSTILAKCRFNRHTLRPIRSAPTHFAGCGMIPWWVLQSEGQLTLFLKHWRTNTVISKTLRIATVWCHGNRGYLNHSFTTSTHPYHTLKQDGSSLSDNPLKKHNSRSILTNPTSFLPNVPMIYI
jgi:hypothetical protein